MNAYEVNFDGIVGPTHNYGGLSWGNLASMKHKLSVSSPKQAALQGLAKMKFLTDLGVKQAVLPPHERPHVPTLRRLGFTGSDAQVIECAFQSHPELLAQVSSASAMWTANAATVSPSADCADRRVHFTPANLVSTFHRSLETATTAKLLRRIFADENHFAHHTPLPPSQSFADEGAANHTRLWANDDEPVIEIFTYGRDASETTEHTSGKFPARQTLLAAQAVARLHQLHPANTRFFKQSPAAIDAGAFHNDVVCVGHRNVLLIHPQAWEQQDVAIRAIREFFQASYDAPLYVIQPRISLSDAVASYLFNSQIVTQADGTLALIAPVESEENQYVRQTIESILESKGPIRDVFYLDVRQSMRNGGGPACLRLRVMLNAHELSRMHQGVLLTDSLYSSLVQWIERHYRDELRFEDLADPKLLDESRAALDELTRILDLGNLYEFQQCGAGLTSADHSEY